MGAFISPLAQLALSIFTAPAGRPGRDALHRLLISVIGIVAAAILASVALVILAFSLVIWVLPPGTTTLEINLLTAALLAFTAFIIWLTTSQGKTPHEVLDDALEPETYHPVESFTRSAH